MARKKDDDLSGVKLSFVEGTEDVLDCRAWLGERRDRIAYDCETTGLNLGSDTVRLWQVGDRDHGWAFPTDSTVSWYGAFKEVMDIVSHGDVPVYAHNAIFDSSFAKRDGFSVPQSLAHDTMVMAQLHNSALPHGLKPTARRMVSSSAVAGEEMLGNAEKKQGWNWENVPFDFPFYWQYAALDPVLTCRIAEKLEPKVFERYRRSYEIEMASIHVLRDAQLAGMQIDPDYCRSMSTQLAAEMAGIQPMLPCNPNAPKQVVEFLQSNGAVLVKKTESGNGWAVDDDVLKFWEQKIPLCAQIRRYRQCSKLKSSYFDKMLDLEVDGIVHPSIRVLGAHKTGRMSVTDPALQTLPKSKIGRSAFVSREGHTLVMADFSGIEMRLLAAMANEENMIARYAEGVDLHTWTATQIFETQEPTDKQRDVAKRSGFAKIYSAGLETFALSTGLPISEAERFLAQYDDLFPRVKEFQEKSKQEVLDSRPGDKRYGEVHTQYGRRLFVPKDQAHTKAVNYQDQGTAGEVLKDKLGELDAVGLGSYIRLPIHDEIVFESPDDILDEVIHTIKEVMPDRDSFSVPLEIDVKSAKRWGDVYQ